MNIPLRACMSLPEFSAQLAPAGRLVGLDVGTETIGIAACDTSRMIASPDLTLYRKKWAEDVAALREMVTGNDVAGFVIGYPLNMDGSPGPRAPVLTCRLLARTMRL